MLPANGSSPRAEDAEAAEAAALQLLPAAESGLALGAAADAAAEAPPKKGFAPIVSMPVLRSATEGQVSTACILTNCFIAHCMHTRAHPSTPAPAFPFKN